MAIAGPVGCPHLVGKGSTLSVLVLVGAITVCTGIELAHCLKVGELATFDGAVASIAARWHLRVLEWALGIGAMGIELALLLALVCSSGSRGRMFGGTLEVLARCAVAADVCDIDSNARRSCWRLVGELAVAISTTQVELAHGVLWVSCLTLATHVDIFALACSIRGVFLPSVMPSAVRTASTITATSVVPIKPSATSAATVHVLILPLGVGKLLRQGSHHLVLLLKKGKDLALSICTTGHHEVRIAHVHASHAHLRGHAVRNVVGAMVHATVTHTTGAAWA